MTGVVALSWQKQILRSNAHKNLQKRNNEDFFIQIRNAWLHFTNNDFLNPTSIEEICDQPIFLNPYFKSTQDYFKFTIIRNVCRFLQPFLISSTTFDEKLGFPTANYGRIYKLIMLWT